MVVFASRILRLWRCGCSAIIPKWTLERIDAAFKAEKEQQVNLKSQIPVLIVYGTVIAKENGQVFFFDDIYGYDKTMAKLFAQAYASQH
jgi:murein L,D-transpeptidase YcbB/YkuD